MTGAWVLRRLWHRLRHEARSARRLILPKYSPAALRAALEEVFGDRTLGESQTRLVIPAFDQQRSPLCTSSRRRTDGGLLTDWKQRAIDVALATAAAPTYLPNPPTLCQRHLAPRWGHLGQQPCRCRRRRSDRNPRLGSSKSPRPESGLHGSAFGAGRAKWNGRSGSSDCRPLPSRAVTRRDETAKLLLGQRMQTSAPCSGFRA